MILKLNYNNLCLTPLLYKVPAPPTPFFSCCQLYFSPITTFLTISTCVHKNIYVNISSPLLISPSPSLTLLPFCGYSYTLLVHHNTFQMITTSGALQPPSKERKGIAEQTDSTYLNVPAKDKIRWRLTRDSYVATQYNINKTKLDQSKTKTVSMTTTDDFCSLLHR